MQAAQAGEVQILTTEHIDQAAYSSEAALSERPTSHPWPTTSDPGYAPASISIVHTAAISAQQSRLVDFGVSPQWQRKLLF